MRSVLAVLLILAGAALFAAWIGLVWVPGPPIEEPASLGNTPNPSVAPWTFDPEAEARGYRMDRWKRGLVFYGLPAAGIALVALGAVALAGTSRK